MFKQSIYSSIKFQTQLLHLLPIVLRNPPQVSSRHARSDWSSSGDNKPSLSFAPTFQNSPDPTQTNDMQILISLVPLLVSQSDGYYYSNQLLTHGFHSMQMPRLTGPHLQTGMTIEVQQVRALTSHTCCEILFSL